MIHNIYRPIGSKSAISSLPDGLLVFTDAKDVLSLLHFLLQDASVDLIVLGDINLHHPVWGGAHVRPDSESKHLISMYNAYSLSLLLPPGTITRENNSNITTIHLVFASPPLKNALESCRVRKDPTKGQTITPFYLFSLFYLICAVLNHDLYRKRQTSKP